MVSLPPVERFESNSGARIYRIPMVLFPNDFTGYSFLVLDAGPITLFDAGSGFERSNDDLLNGLEYVRTHFDEKVSLADIDRLIVTHGHIDHFGGVAFIVEQTGARVGIHELDRRVLTAYEERVTMATKDLRIYLERAGISDKSRDEMINLYGFAKRHVRSVQVDFSLDEDVEIEGLRFFHVPGHCPGQVCTLIGDVMLTADHILSRTTPHQAPESITHYTGLGHYLEALRKIAKVDGIALGLGSHEDAIPDVYERIRGMFDSHDRKLNRVLDIIRQLGRPATIKEITRAMYPDQSGYNILLALEEAGAHVEYLYQHGQLSVANLEQVENEDNPALQYVVAD